MVFSYGTLIGCNKQNMKGVKTNMKIKGLKTAVSDYKRANKGAPYSPIYRELMFDKGDGRIWTDEFCDLGHNSYKVYDSKTIIYLGRIMSEREIEINMKNVKEFIYSNFDNESPVVFSEH